MKRVAKGIYVAPIKRYGLSTCFIWSISTAEAINQSTLANSRNIKPKSMQRIVHSMPTMKSISLRLTLCQDFVTQNSKLYTAWVLLRIVLWQLLYAPLAVIYHSSHSKKKKKNQERDSLVAPSYALFWQLMPGKTRSLHNISPYLIKDLIQPFWFTTTVLPWEQKYKWGILQPKQLNLSQNSSCLDHKVVNSPSANTMI